MRYGYARVSTEEQKTHAQIDALQAAGCDVIYEEKRSGGNMGRPVLIEMLGNLKPGDVVIVYKMDRIARSLRDLMDSTDFGESIRHVSAFAAAAEYAESSPKNEMDYKMTGGNSRLAQEFARRVGPQNIKLRTAVTEIDQSKGTVSVKTATELFIADAVVCTVPIQSLLKIKFNPSLPTAHQEAA